MLGDRTVDDAIGDAGAGKTCDSEIRYTFTNDLAERTENAAIFAPNCQECKPATQSGHRGRKRYQVKER